MQLNSIPEQYTSFTSAMVSSTLRQICVSETPFDRYYGLCFNKFDGRIGKHPEFEIDIRLSPLVIDVLFGFKESLALWLFYSFFSYTE